MQSDSVSDERLLERCGSGDQAAFQALYERHNRMIYNLLFRMLGNHSDAEEVLPDVFVRVWLKAADFRGQSRVSTWIYRIAANMAMDRLRSGKSTKEVFWDDLPPQERAMPDRNETVEGPEHAVLRQEEHQRLADAMALLNPEERLLLTMYHLQGCSYAEIEETTGITSANIKSKLFRARRRLRNLMLGLEKGNSPDDVRENSTTSSGLRMAIAFRK